MAAEMRERIAEELDYELEAQSQRRIERLCAVTRSSACRASTPSFRHAACSYRSTSRATDFEAVRRADEAQRDRYGEIVFRFFFGLLYRDGIALGDPHPGNYLLRADGRVGFLDFGLLRDVERCAPRSGGGDRARGPRAGRRRAQGRPDCERLSAWRSRRRRRRRACTAVHAPRHQVVCRARHAPVLGWA